MFFLLKNILREKHANCILSLAVGVSYKKSWRFLAKISWRFLTKKRVCCRRRKFPDKLTFRPVTRNPEKLKTHKGNGQMAVSRFPTKNQLLPTRRAQTWGFFPSEKDLFCWRNLRACVFQCVCEFVAGCLAYVARVSLPAAGEKFNFSPSFQKHSHRNSVTTWCCVSIFCFLSVFYRRRFLCKKHFVAPPWNIMIELLYDRRWLDANPITWLSPPSPLSADATNTS